jgi:hypothetical protein
MAEIMAQEPCPCNRLRSSVGHCIWLVEVCRLVYKFLFMKRLETGRFRIRTVGTSGVLRRLLRMILAGTAAFAAAGTAGSPAQEPPSPAPPHGLQIVTDGGYPELRIDGKPFFIHSAAFHYYRIPYDQWSYLLERYRELGINTIDIYIPWNWHEPREGEFDFDGHTNPRRNLRSLLQLITGDGFKLIARPGPEILNEWKNGGYPDWLLSRPEYHMNLADVLEGRYPPLAGLNTHDAEAAAQAWLGNPVHMKYARDWLEAVAHELAPYSAETFVTVSGNGHPLKASGPLLFVQLEDDMAIGRTNYAGPAFWRYMESLRSMLRDGGLRVAVFINPTDMRVSAAGQGLPDPIGAMGQWYMAPRGTDGAGERLLDDEDASEIEFYTEELKTQPDFPPIMIEYQAGWYCPADDDRPIASPPENTLLSSRLLIANGILGFNYFPLQDTFTPAGYSVPWANRFYRWDAPLDINGSDQPRSAAVRRDAEFLGIWGPQLAASHKRVDFGIVYPVGSFPQEKLTSTDITAVSETILRLEMLGQLTHLSSELLDPEYQPVEQLLRDAVIFLPVFDPTKPEFLMSEKSQHALAEYVRRGGTLVIFPNRAPGDVFGQFWQSPTGTISKSGIRFDRTDFGSGHLIEIQKDFYSWMDLEESYSFNAVQPSFLPTSRVLTQILEEAKIRPVVRLEYSKQPSSELVVTEIVSNDGSGDLGERTGGSGFLSVSNLSEKTAVPNLEILSPRASARSSASPGSQSRPGNLDVIPLHLEIPPRESLLLPLEQPLCRATMRLEKCNDSIIASGAEFLSADRVGKALELTFYSPARSTVLLRFEEKPKIVTMFQNLPRVRWDGYRHELHLSVPRGAAPDFRRVVKLDLRDQPDLPEKSRPKRELSQNYLFRVLNAVPLDLGDTASFESYPPLVILEKDRPEFLLLEAQNLPGEMTGKISVRLEGALQGSSSLHPREEYPSLGKLKLKWPTGASGQGTGLSAGPDGLIHETLDLRSVSGERKLPVAFLISSPGVSDHYRFDFDRDSAKEWVLENDHLRLVFSPASGGNLLSLVDKDALYDLLSSVGGLRDGFTYWGNPPGQTSDRERGRYGLFNRAYVAEWEGTGTTPGLQMHYDARDILPGGASIEKQIRLDGADSFFVDYRVSLASPKTASFNHRQSFAVSNSIAVSADRARPTHFCWTPPQPSTTLAHDSAFRNTDPPLQHCEAFVSGGKPIAVPPGVDSMKIYTRGRPGLAIEWKTGTMAIEPQSFSALLKFEFPPLVAGGGEAKYSVRFHLLPPEK